ncbi:A/G-specific adenine glycosylase [Kribbella solani]|uniref:A/G-specific adenine glycosylase n=1 Tax=Kribbella solani TaxID=236067 RepID=UPI0029BD906F|nr:A/G-specific adenine glycosylase [Kribbella solani]MDX2970928.1 A/G-specific adenine glycosylase [Kribbella solani]MDX3001090.1 A/G-specific adenine glycosylase [Kribbella solani]
MQDHSGSPLPIHDAVLRWYDANARVLPWRGPDASPWAVMVSEFMLQQTPVNRVLPAYQKWLERWPKPVDLAAAAPGEAVRAWDRLGYPRRALRLHAAAQAIVERHGGDVPDDHAELLALPGVGTYTAAAIASFAFGQRHAVVDTNVRRVLARALTGVARPAISPTAADQRLAVSALPADEPTAARWAVASMELGALVCTARTPHCAECPIRSQCAWVLAGSPPYDGPPRRGQTYEGTDRQARGRLLAVLRAADTSVPKSALDACWPDAVQRERALDGLVADGLVEPLAGNSYRLPT